MWECVGEQVGIFRNMAHPVSEDRPGIIDAVMHGPGHFVFLGVPGHLELRHHRKDGLGGQQVVESFGQSFLGRRVEPVLVGVRNAEAPVVKHHTQVARPEVPQPRSVARDALADAVIARACGALGAEADTALADPEAEAVGGA